MQFTFLKGTGQPLPTRNLLGRYPSWDRVSVLHDCSVPCPLKPTPLDIVVTHFHDQKRSWAPWKLSLWVICYESPVCWEPAHEIPPLTRSWGENLTGKADQVFRDSEKLPLALTLKMISVFLMLASIDYSLISVTQAEGLPWFLSK